MPCDRCIHNTSCEDYKPGSRCAIEKEEFTKIVSSLLSEFDSDSTADKLLTERVAMNIIRVSRMEAYEATVGLCENSDKLGTYMTRMDNTVRSILNELAATRSKRFDLEKTHGELVNLDEVIRKVMSTEKRAANKPPGLEYRTFEKAPISPKVKLEQIWEKEYPKLEKLWKKNKNVKKEKNNYIPIKAIRELAENVELSEQMGKSKSKKETFKHILSLMDKYRDYFFSDEWPEEWVGEKATEFTAQDLAFINENDDEYRDRVITVLTKKTVTKQGLNSIQSSLTFRAFIEKFIKPDLLEVSKRFVDLTKTTQNPEDLLKNA